MNLFSTSRKTLSLFTLFAAGTLHFSPAFATGETVREAFTVSDEAALREILSEKYQPDGTTEDKDKIYRDNADITLSTNIRVETTRTESVEIKDGEGNVTGTQSSVCADNAIEILAANCNLFGAGFSISSSEIALDTKGSGDLFFLSGNTFAVENITFSGTSDSTKKTGRAFTTGNSLFSTLLINPGTTFENRRLVADELTNYRAHGGALASAHIMDEVWLKSSSASGTIVFSGNVVLGKSLSYESSGETVTENLSAFGGAISASGLLSVYGDGNAVFEKNAALSETATATGGAIFIVNASLNRDGSLSSASIYPDSVVDETGKKKFGLQVAETKLTFSENFAQGTDAQGGAVAVSGGYFNAENSEIIFSGNSVKNNSVGGGKILGGALYLGEGAKAGFDAGTSLRFENNFAEAQGEQTSASGGALAISDASLSLAGTTIFSGNAVSSAFGGSALSGGAFRISGTQKTVTKPDETKEKVHTSVATLAGTLVFEKNRVSATALSAEKDMGTPDKPSSETLQSSAQGGAIALSGGKIDGSELSSLVFSENTAEAKTFAQGGALASLNEITELTLKTTGEFSFTKNTATLLALASGETQTENLVPLAQGGAIYASAGTLDLSAAGTLTFSENVAEASAQENGLAQGGAIFQNSGKLFFGASEFSKNKVVSRVAQGGAIFSAGGEQNFSGGAVFSDNQALAGTETSPAGTTFACGGAIFAETSAVLNFSGTTQFSTSAALAKSASGADANGLRSGAAGGAIYSTGTLNFGEVSFANGTAVVSGDANGAAFGGAVYVAGGKFSAASLVVRSLSAAASGDAFGGAIYTESAGVLDVSGDFEASANLARGISGTNPKNASGGAIYSAGTLRVGGNFSATGNSATGIESAFGGAATVAGGIFALSGSQDNAHEISGNRASASSGNAYGGGLSVVGGTFRQSSGTLNLSGNAAEAANGGNAFGGAVYLSGGTVELTNAEISGNTATAASGGNAYGGAVFIDAGTAAASTLKLAGNTNLSGNSANGAADGIYVGIATGTEAKSAVSVILDTKATLTQNEDGSVSRTEVEAATISDCITADKATVALTKTGAGDLTLGEISAINDAKISLAFDGGVSTLAGAISALEKFSVASGAEVALQSEFGGYKTAKIAGTLSVSGSGAVWNFVSGSETELTGTLAFDGVSTKISGASSVSGSGTFSVKNATAFTFADASAHLTAANLAVGAGTLTLDGAGRLDITGKLVFNETGNAEIALANGATLGIVEVARTADNVSAKISGTGTLVLYTDAGTTEPPTQISFSEFFEKIKDAESGEETTVIYKGSFEIADSVKVQAGIAVSQGVTLKLSPDSAPDANFVGKKNILLKGGTLLTDAGKTLELETFSADGNAQSVLGAAGENQRFEMVEVTVSGTDDEGNPTATTKRNALKLSGQLEITETTTFAGDIAFSGNSGALSGAGTLDGNLSGTGAVSLVKINGNVNIGNGTTITASGSISVAGDANIYYGDASPARAAGTTANAILKLSGNTSFSAQNIYNYGRIVAGDGTTLSGNIVNAGTLIVEKDSTLKIADGSVFANGNAAESLAGTIDLSALNSAIDFSAIADETKITLDNGVVRIDATKLASGDALPILGIEDEAIFENLKIEDVGNYVLSDRFMWDAAAEKFVFLGLNGERFHGTLYGDLQRESLNATYDFMRQTLVRGGSRTLTPELYGAYKLQSAYMRGYIEKVRQRGGEVPAQLEAKRKAELAMAEKLNSRLVNFWVQGNASFGEQRERKGFGAYDSERIGALAGASLPFKNWELGLAITGSEENYDMRGAAHHETETSAYGLSGYAFYKNDWFDWTAGTAGMLFSSDSKRDGYSGDFDGWRLGVMTEFGATLRAQSWLAIRAFAGLSAAYSHVGSFSESGGEGALSVDSDGAAGVRGNVGLSSAFLLSDTLQLKVRTAWLVDFGNDTCSLDAYMPGTHTDYVIDSRENESSALEAGASLNWTFSESTEIFVDYTGTIRAGERDNAVSVGLNYFF